MDDFAKKNVQRVNLKLQDLVREVQMSNQNKIFKHYHITELKTVKECTLEDIDFNKSVIFICSRDFLGYIGYYGLLKVNKVAFPDTTQSGIYSMIRTSYMIVESSDIRFSMIPQDSFYDPDRDFSLPESWNSINYVSKDICLWRLVLEVGIGDNNKMYNGCASWIAERYRTAKLDWVFFLTKQEKASDARNEFNASYGSMLPTAIPIYFVSKKAGKEGEFDEHEGSVEM